ncbi:hypothetical protein FALBO_5004 [Fusarium albosuccineum]|uniref:NACHT-NTPase and P-loop NTPases N-terminal domain-containing protein n=1 Tax=Fusarium albosuccineum TaxID=1237068 RepID=A0A8H4LIK1_9HYPO|nr:hypothetical protein FALBO_5004 [Fusarium albosuccineum]
MADTCAELISKTIATLEEAAEQYEVVKDDKGLRKAFHEAGRGLVLIRKALQAANAQLGVHNITGDPKSAMDAVNGCKDNAELSKRIFNAVAQEPETSRFERYKKFVNEEGNGRPVEVLIIAMMKSVCALAENDAIKAEMEDQVKGLRDAIEKLSKMEPPVPKDGSNGNTFTNFGSGDMLNAPHGSVNKSEGSGFRFPGAVFSGGATFSK